MNEGDQLMIDTSNLVSMNVMKELMQNQKRRKMGDEDFLYRGPIGGGRTSDPYRPEV